MRQAKIYGYARVSTMKQSIDRQIDNIRKKFPEAVIIAESYTGTTMERPNWNKLFKALKAGDTVVFDEVSRMSRNAEEGFQTYKQLYDMGVNLIFIKESTLNTENFRNTAQVAMTGGDVDVILEGVNKFLMILAEKQIQSAFETAQHEVDFLHQRTSEGVKKAQERWEREELLGLTHEKDKVGLKAGTKLTTKKSVKAKEIIRKHCKDFDGSLSDDECMDLAKVARNTYYKYKREIKTERAPEN